MENFKYVIKSGISKILSGFLLGLGFSLSFLGIYYYMNNQIQEEMMGRYKGEEEKITSVEFIHHEDKKFEDKLTIIGSLKNSSTETIDSITLEAEFFENEIFVDECTEYISGKIHPGDIENFKVSCGGCGDYQSPNYDNYTLRVISVSN